MMIVRVLLILACSACRIPGDHFIGIGGGDDAGGGDDGSGSNIDAPIATTSGWVVDDGPAASGGFYRVNKATGGAITLVTGGYVGFTLAHAAVVNREGTHLLVAGMNGTNTLFAIPIGPNGVLDVPNMLTKNVACTIQSIALHPTGRYLAVGCTTATAYVVLLSNGVFASGNPLVFSPNGAMSMQDVAFSPDGLCLFVADDNTGTNNDLHYTTFDPGNGTLGSPAGVQGSSRSHGIAFHPNAPYMYVGGSSAISIYSLNGCTPSFSASATITNNSAQTWLAIQKNPGRLFAGSGNRITPFTLNALPTLSAIPSAETALAGGTTIRHFTQDPALDDMLYITTGSGTFPGTIMPGATITLGTSVAVSSGSWFTLRP